MHFLPLSFLLGPALFFYVKHTVSGEKRLLKYDLLHLIPATMEFFADKINITDFEGNKIVLYKKTYQPFLQILNRWIGKFREFYLSRSPTQIRFLAY